MDFTGEYRVPAPIERVWSGINDPEVLRRCVDGCEEMTRISDTEFAGAIKVKLGVFTARFKGTITLSNVRPPRACSLTVRGQGGLAGFAKGHARIELIPDGDGTILIYGAKAEVGGRLAKIGAKVARGVVDRSVIAFFDRFSNEIAGTMGQDIPIEAVGEAQPAHVPEETREEVFAPPPPDVEPPPEDDDERDHAPRPIGPWAMWLAISVLVILLAVIAALVLG